MHSCQGRSVIERRMDKVRGQTYKRTMFRQRAALQPDTGSADFPMASDMPDFAQLRRNMVDNQLRTFSITDRKVLEAMLAVPRELFLPAALVPIAYSDAALDIAAGQGFRRMLTPMTLARMAQAAEISPGDRILDVGGAAGYSAAVLSRLGGEVVALEVDEALVRSAAANLARAGVAHARAVGGPLEAGFAAGAPYDVIFINGMLEIEPEALLRQLGPKGRLVAIRRPTGDPTGRAGKAIVLEKGGQSIGERDIFDATAPILPGFQAAPAFAF